MDNIVVLVAGDIYSDYSRFDLAVYRCSLSPALLVEAYKKGANKIKFDIAKVLDNRDSGYLAQEEYDIIDSNLFSDWETIPPWDVNDGWGEKGDPYPLAAAEYFEIYMHVAKLGYPDMSYDQVYHKYNSANSKVNTYGSGLFRGR